MTTYTIQAMGAVVVFTASTPCPAGATNKDHYYLSVAEARQIITGLTAAAEAAEKADARAKAERVSKLQAEISAKQVELSVLRGELDGLQAPPFHPRSKDAGNG